jgi:hypothetical protein
MLYEKYQFLCELETERAEKELRSGNPGLRQLYGLLYGYSGGV